MNCAEINSSFHRVHRPSTYRRWAESTPPDFRFSVKLPRTITHVARLRDAGEPLSRFLGETAELGAKLSVLLVQLPPTLLFDAKAVSEFFVLLHQNFEGAVVCEPRHKGWFTPAVDRALSDLRIGRAAVNPAGVPQASHAGGWLGPAGDGVGAVVYHRWHGEPQVYFSRYDVEWLYGRAAELARLPKGFDCWCIFDNTARGAAIANALEMRTMVETLN